MTMRTSIPGHQLSKQAFIAKHMPDGMFTKEYLALRWEWMRETNPSKDLNARLRTAYCGTEACRIYHPERYAGHPEQFPLYKRKRRSYPDVATSR